MAGKSLAGRIRAFLAFALLSGQLLGIPMAAKADDMMIETFDMQPETRWRFFTDGVMGGVSSGQVVFLDETGQTYARMTGKVSTANNGGFIQMRMDLTHPAPEGSSGVRLVARGNDQRYFVHLRTGGTMLPWQYYQAGFAVTGEWTEIRLPFDSFKASGRLLRPTPRPAGLKSVAVVAFGRDHEALIDILEIGFY